MPNRHPADLYDPQAAPGFLNPFNLQADPMVRLLLINFERDPDQTYIGFEPQVFDDPLNGRGLLVIAWRVDGRVDVYHQPGLTLAPGKYDMVAKGLAGMFERPFEGARFEITGQGVDLEVDFEDERGRPVRLRIHERGGKERRPFSLLAPFPSSSEHAPSLPLPLLFEFDFVRRAGTEMEIRIGDRRHQPDNLPVPMDGSWVFFTRYSRDPLILSWNHNHDGPLAALEASQPGAHTAGGVTYTLAENAGQLELRSLSPVSERHKVEFVFEPAFPNLGALRDGAQASGTFRVEMGPSMGQVSGEYRVERHGQRASIELHPSGGWQPGPLKWSVRLMFFIVRVFKSWPKTYRWQAQVDLSAGGGAAMKSAWHRIEQP